MNTSGSHNFFQTLHPSISARTTHGLPLITSPSKMTTVLICRNTPTDSCRNLTALMPRCTKTSFLITPHYICAHRNSDNLHNAAFKGYSLVAWIMADEHLIVVLHQIVGVIQVFKLHPQWCPLDSSPGLCCACLHSPIDDQKNEEQRQQAAWSNSNFHIETVG